MNLNDFIGLRPATDSRKIEEPERSVFFALKTPKNDGHKYIGEAYAKGVRQFVVSPPKELREASYSDAVFYETDDTLVALQSLAAERRRQFGGLVVGITGSRGKTIVKEWLYQLLNENFDITRSPRSYNSQLGVPLSVWCLPNPSEGGACTPPLGGVGGLLGIFEAGISERGEMERLERIIRPEIGIITNVSEAHDDGFSSLKEKCLEKLKLFKDSQVVIYNADNRLIDICAEQSGLRGRRFTWGRLQFSSTTLTNQRAAIEANADVIIENEERRMNNDSYYTEITFSCPRFNIQHSTFNIPFTDDASVENALHCLALLLYLNVDTDTIARRMDKLEAVPMAMRVPQLMSDELRNETRLEVNLSALVGNFNAYRSRLAAGVKMVCMVKAFGYGSGATETARTLEAAGADYLAVAVADEGAELRGEGIRIPVLVMNPERHAFGLLFDHRLEPEIYSFRLLHAFIAEAEKRGEEGFPIHLKIDTGMHRLGFAPEDIESLAALLLAHPAVRAASVFSHLAGAEDPALDDFTREQARRFEDAARRLTAALGYAPLRHLLNSAGIERFPEYSFDMARLGIGLYSPSESLPNPSEGGACFPPLGGLRGACTLRTTILQIKTLPAGETVGYNRRGRLARTSRIAILPIGYADGFDRRLGNGAWSVMVGGKPAPTVGNVSMDLTAVDVTDLAAGEGDEVEVFGENLPLDLMAHRLSTITYEILTGISRRVKRVYYVE